MSGFKQIISRILFALMLLSCLNGTTFAENQTGSEGDTLVIYSAKKEETKEEPIEEAAPAIAPTTAEKVPATKTAGTLAPVLKRSVKGYTYFLYVPTTYQKSNRYPLILALHWSTGRGTDMIERWKKEAELRGYIVVAPNSKNSDYWQIPGEEKKIFTILKDVRKDYSLDKKRTYVTGFSAGATFAYYLGLQYPTFFDAAAPYAGRLKWIEENVKITSKKRIPFFILNGQKDIQVGPNLAQYAHNRLRQSGHTVKLMLIPGIDHQYPDFVSIHIMDWFESL